MRFLVEYVMWFCFVSKFKEFQTTCSPYAPCCSYIYQHLPRHDQVGSHVPCIQRSPISLSQKPW